MRGRLLLLSPLLILLCSFPVNATTDGDPKATALDNERSSGIDFDLPTYDYVPAMSWADSVMMTRLPPGSLRIQYDGLQKVIIKHARSQVRHYARKYRDHKAEASHDIDVWNDAPTLNSWWTRSWMDSLPSNKGGAPDEPYVHTIGQEITWRLGPLSLTNTLKLKIDYFAVFKFNPDPGEKTGDRDPPPVSFDVRSNGIATVGTWIKFKVRPSVRVGMPDSDGWFSVLRSIAIRAEFDIVLFGVRFVSGDIVLKYKSGDELSLQIGLTIGNW